MARSLCGSHCLFVVFSEVWQLHSHRGSSHTLVMVPRSAAPRHSHLEQQASTNTAVLERLSWSLAGQSLKHCWGLFFCIPCSLSSRTQETALSFLLCASSTSLMSRAVLVTIKLIIIPSSAAHCQAHPAVSESHPSL